MQAICKKMIKILLHFFLLSFKYPKVPGYLIFYSELRLIFVYLESDSWYWSAWVSPRLFLGQAGCSGLTWFVRWREGGQSSNPSHLTPTESQRERAWAEPRQRERERDKTEQVSLSSLPPLTDVGGPVSFYLLWKPSALSGKRELWVSAEFIVL